MHPRAALRFVALVVLLPAAESVQAQPAGDGSYLPLQEGNTWTYYLIRYPPDRPPDTTLYDPIALAAPFSLDGREYYRYDLPNLPVDTMRSDGEGRIYHRDDGEDRLLFDFTLEAGTSYDYDPFVVTVERGMTVETIAGRFEDCIRFQLTIPGAADATFYYTFAADVGLVIAVDGMGEPQFLYSAVVDGREVTAREMKPARDPLNFEHYPNPAADRVTFQITLPSPAFVRLRVFDEAGREVAVPMERYVTMPRLHLQWNTSGLAAGVYMARLQVGGRVATRVVVLGQ